MCNLRISVEFFLNHCQEFFHWVVLRMLGGHWNIYFRATFLCVPQKENSVYSSKINFCVLLKNFWPTAWEWLREIGAMPSWPFNFVTAGALLTLWGWWWWRSCQRSRRSPWIGECRTQRTPWWWWWPCWQWCTWWCSCSCWPLLKTTTAHSTRQKDGSICKTTEAKIGLGLRVLHWTPGCILTYWMIYLSMEHIYVSSWTKGKYRFDFEVISALQLVKLLKTQYRNRTYIQSVGYQFS